MFCTHFTLRRDWIEQPIYDARRISGIVLRYFYHPLICLYVICSLARTLPTTRSTRAQRWSMDRFRWSTESGFSVPSYSSSFASSSAHGKADRHDMTLAGTGITFAETRARYTYLPMLRRDERLSPWGLCISSCCNPLNERLLIA